MEDYHANPRKYEWPDWRVQIYFKKLVSQLWQNKLDDQYMYDPETLARKFRKIANDDGQGGRLRVDNLPEICDKLGLHLLMNSEDMSYHFRFVDVINGTANAFLEDPSYPGYIDFEK